MTQILREQKLCLFTTVPSESRAAPDTQYLMSAQLTQAEPMRSISRNAKTNKADLTSFFIKHPPACKDLDAERPHR